jgi:hemoglobin
MKLRCLPGGRQTLIDGSIRFNKSGERFATVNATEQFRYRADEAGITPQLIESVVVAFYGKVRVDPVLGPIFENAIGADWDAHIKRIISFWLTATRLARGYEGRRFMPAHLQHRSIHADHLPRWLALFRQTLEERCSPLQATVLADIAERMAENIELGLNRREAGRQPDMPASDG